MTMATLPAHYYHMTPERQLQDIQDRDEEREEFARMDNRLRRWAIWCKSGAPKLDDNGNKIGQVLTRDDIADAWAIQCMVMRLPIEARMVIQVWYVHVGDIADQRMEPWQEVNLRLSRAKVETRISRDMYRPARDRAVRMLINTNNLTPNKKL